MHPISDLTTAVMKSYADVPDVTVLSDIFDVKSWLTLHLLKLYNHSHPHIFRFSLFVGRCCNALQRLEHVALAANWRWNKVVQGKNMS